MQLEVYLINMKIIAISDTHGAHTVVTVPKGDVLVHSGDFCRFGWKDEFKNFIEWFASHPHKHKVMTCGNHDMAVAKYRDYCKSIATDLGVHLLLDEEVIIDSIKFYGSPWTPKFYNWHFMENRGENIAKIWAKIPEDTDVLITHGPAYGHGDPAPGNRLAGCFELLKRIMQVEPKVHFFGHIHEGHGRTVSDEIRTVFINAAIMNGRYKPVNQAMEFTI